MMMLNWVYFSRKVLGKENLPKDESYILACNHVSNLDPFILGIIDRRKFCFLAKEELFKKSFIGFMLRQMGAFPIKRDKRDLGALKEALKRVKTTPLILFPEGTRGVSGRDKKAQPGIGFIAVKSGKPVVPVYITGTEKAFPNGAKWFRRHRVIVKVGKPQHFSAASSYEEISSQILDQIYALAMV